MPVYAIPSQQLMADINASKKTAVIAVSSFLKHCDSVNYDIYFSISKRQYDNLSINQSIYSRILFDYLKNNTSHLAVVDDFFVCGKQSFSSQLMVNGEKASDCFNSLFLYYTSKDTFIPIVISDKKQIITKNRCTIACHNKSCSLGISIEYPGFSSESFDKLQEIARYYNFDNLLFRNRTAVTSIYTDMNNKYRSLVNSFLDMLGVDKNKRKSFSFTKFFIDDFKNNIDSVLFPILLSVARVIGFPPAEKDKSNLEPIDYHEYTTAEIPRKYQILRADILSSIKFNGILGNSGNLRAFIVVLNNTYYFIGFTSKHDFNNTEMLERIEKTEKEIG